MLFGKFSIQVWYSYVGPQKLANVRLQIVLIAEILDIF